MSDKKLIGTRVDEETKNKIEKERLTYNHGMSEYLRDLVKRDLGLGQYAQEPENGKEEAEA